MEAITVFLVDDCSVTRDGLESILGAHDDIRVVGSSQDGMESADLIRSVAPDVVLVDAQLPDISGAELTRRIKRFSAPVRVLFLAVHSNHLKEGLAAGADAALLKDVGRKELLSTVREVAGGR